MPQSAVQTLTAVGSTPWIPINLNAFNNGVGLLVTLQGGTGTFGCDVTGDKLVNIPAQVPTHINAHDVLTNLTASKNSSLAYPCTAIRLTATALSAGATVTLAVVQTVS